MSGRAVQTLGPLAVVAGLLLAWEAAASWGLLADVLGLEDFLVASPAQIGEVLWQDRAILASNARVTLVEVLLGFGCALAAGAGAAIALHLSAVLRASFYPLLVASQTIPVVVIAPILVVWFGFGIGPKLAIIALICFFPIAVNTLDGLRSVDPEAVRMMRTLYASRMQILWRVELPGALPYLFTGAKIAIAVAVIGAVFGEWAGSSAGLGHMILQDNAQLLTARMFAAVTVLSAMAMALFGALSLVERRLVGWRGR